MGHAAVISDMSMEHSLPRPTGEPRLSQSEEQQAWAVKEMEGEGHQSWTVVQVVVK